MTTPPSPCPPAGQLRVALMLPRFSRYGGVEQFGYHLSVALAAKGYAVDFICARQEAEAPDGVRVISVGRPVGAKVIKMLWFLARAEQVRRTNNYDLVISLGKTWNQDITRVGGGPLTVFWRLSEEAWPAGLPRARKKLSRLLNPANWLSLYLEKRMFTHTRHIVPISETVKGWLLQAHPHLAETTVQSLHTIYNCPDVSRFAHPTPEERAQGRLQFGMAQGIYAVGVATTNFRLKGVGPLIRALALLPQEFADTHLYVAGGREAAEYENLAKAEGVASRVHFCGKVDAMPLFYKSLDMFVLPTLYDTLGNAVLEALATGLPTLCSHRAGAADFFPAEQILTDPANPEHLAAKIAWLRRQTHWASFSSKGDGIADLVALAERVLQEKRVLR